MNRHPADGARIIFASDKQLDLAAVVAYEYRIGSMEAAIPVSITGVTAIRPAVSFTYAMSTTRCARGVRTVMRGNPSARWNTFSRARAPSSIRTSRARSAG